MTHSILFHLKRFDILRFLSFQLIKIGKSLSRSGKSVIRRRNALLNSLKELAPRHVSSFKVNVSTQLLRCIRIWCISRIPLRIWQYFSLTGRTRVIRHTCTLLDDLPRYCGDCRPRVPFFASRHTDHNFECHSAANMESVDIAQNLVILPVAQTSYHQMTTRIVLHFIIFVNVL